MPHGAGQSCGDEAVARAALGGRQQAFVSSGSSSWEACGLICSLACCLPRSLRALSKEAPCDVIRDPNGETEVAVTQHLPTSSLWLLVLLLILTTALKRLLPPHFLQWETEAQQDLISCPRPYTQKVAEPRFEPGLSGSKAVASGSQDRGLGL